MGGGLYGYVCVYVCVYNHPLQPTPSTPRTTPNHPQYTPPQAAAKEYGAISSSDDEDQRAFLSDEDDEQQPTTQAPTTGVATAPGAGPSSGTVGAPSLSSAAALVAKEKEKALPVAPTLNPSASAAAERAIEAAVARAAERAAAIAAEAVAGLSAVWVVVWGCGVANTTTPCTTNTTLVLQSPPLYPRTSTLSPPPTPHTESLRGCTCQGSRSTAGSSQTRHASLCPPRGGRPCCIYRHPTKSGDSHTRGHHHHRWTCLCCWCEFCTRSGTKSGQCLCCTEGTTNSTRPSRYACCSRVGWWGAGGNICTVATNRGVVWGTLHACCTACSRRPHHPQQPLHQRQSQKHVLCLRQSWKSMSFPSKHGTRYEMP